MANKFFVDRIEEDTVFCEGDDGEEIKFDLSSIEGRVLEGDVVFRDETGNIKTDFDATLLRKKKISNLKKCIYNTKK